jgi:hypothetical protein
LLLGGGYRPEASQVQIELNVRWIQQLLAEMKPGVRVETFFAAGDGPSSLDVIESRAGTSTLSTPLARLFGALERSTEVYFHNRVPGLSGSLEKGPLIERLSALFSAAGPGDQILFLFNGHGLGGPAGPEHNTLRLWGDEEISVIELGALLDRAPPSTRVRMFFPQCFSGGFTRLIQPKGARSREVVAADRCGFYSQDELLEAEGCTPSVEVDDFRDYSTYFFSAISGRTRSGQPLAFDPDRDRDGRVTLLEAHYYALLAADSADLPRSTSEAYLERWQPWFMRAEATSTLPSSVSAGAIASLNAYVELAETLGERLTGQRGRAALERAFELRSVAARARERIAKERAELNAVVEAKLRPIRLATEARYPAAFRPYTQAFLAFYRSPELELASAFVAAAPGYGELVVAQDRLRALQLEDLAERRRGAGFDRYFRLRRLAQIAGQFQRLASAEERKTMERLLRCEDSPL